MPPTPATVLAPPTLLVGPADTDDVGSERPGDAVGVPPAIAPRRRERS
jgi:hypothetical protein